MNDMTTLTSARKTPPQQDSNHIEQARKQFQVAAINVHAFYRIWHILGDKEADPPIQPLLPISRAAFYAGINAGRYPAPVKLSARVSAWRGKDLLTLLESF